MEKSVDGEEVEAEELTRRWADAGRLIERACPALFAALLAAAEATAVEISSAAQEVIS